MNISVDENFLFRETQRGIVCRSKSRLLGPIGRLLQKSLYFPAEELGHHYVLLEIFWISPIPANAKQERQARMWTHERLDRFAWFDRDAYQHGCREHRTG